MPRLSLTFSFALITLVSLGCSSSSRIPVHGSVTFEDGAPLTGGAVVFSDEANGTSSIGSIQQDGSFVLGTIEPGDGAPAGHYKVTISPPTDPATDRVLVPIDDSFRDIFKTPLSVEVTPDDYEFDLKVKAPAKRR